MKKKIKLAITCLTIALFTLTAAAQETIKVWGDQLPPGAQGTDPEDTPTLTIYKPEGKASGASVLIFPGGGYFALDPEAQEGKSYAKFLNQYGITAFVLKYRLGPKYHHPCMLQDASRAMRVIRLNAEKWGLDPNRVGVMGSSAGGHLACSMVTLFEKGDEKKLDPMERISTRPDLGILCYTVVTMVGSEFNPGEYCDLESKVALIGEDPSADLIQYLSPEKMVSKDTPPCFIWHTLEDNDVDLENPIMFMNALRKEKVPFELHIFEHGPHGCGLNEHEVEIDGKKVTKVHPWADALVAWLKFRHFIDE